MINSDINSVLRVQEVISDSLQQGGYAEPLILAQNLLQEFTLRNPKRVNTHQWFKGEIEILKKRLGATDLKAYSVCVKILRYQQSLFTVNTHLQIPSKDIPTPIAIVLDLNAPDFNGAITAYLWSAVLNEMPIVTTRTLFSSAKLQPKKKRFRPDMYRRVIKNYSLFSKDGYLVLVPHSFNPTLSWQEKLKKLDLEKLDEVTLAQALTHNDEIATLEGLTGLFSTQANNDKVIWTAGHGGMNVPVGLPTEKYREYLRWAENQRCKGFVLTSCYSGGESSLLHLPDQSRSFPGVSFPVIVRCVGDMPSEQNLATEGQLKQLNAPVKLLSQLFNLPAGCTFRRIRHLFQEQGTNLPITTPNLAQVYFPSTKDLPSGFRSFEDCENHLPLTHLKYHRHQLKNQPVEVAANVLVSPVVVECPVVFKNKKPAILSSVPGKSSHFFSKVIINSSHREFMKSVVNFSKLKLLGVSKALFIQTLQFGNDKWSQVFINLKTGVCGYHIRGKYYYYNPNDGDERIEISALTYFSLWNETKKDSKPDDRAVRVATSGQQSSADVEQALTGPLFLGDQTPAYSRCQEILKVQNLKSMDLEDLCRITQEFRLSVIDKVQLVSRLIGENEELACAYFTRMKLPPNSADLQGFPLTVFAARGNHTRFLRVLIKAGVNIDIASTSTGNTALNVALSIGHREFVNILLAHGADVNSRNKEGIPAFTSAILNEELFDLCRARQPLEMEVKKITDASFLGIAIETGNPVFVTRALDAGANPNGITKEEYCLISALNGPVEVLEIMLKGGANPYLDKVSRISPAEHAMRHSSLKRVELLLSIPNPEVDEDKKQITARKIFLAALQSGEEGKIRAALKLNPKLISTMPEHVSHEPSPILSVWDCECIRERKLIVEGFKQMVLFGNDSLLKDLHAEGHLNLPMLIKNIKIISEDWLDYSVKHVHSDDEWHTILIKKVLELETDPTKGLSLVLQVDPKLLCIESAVKGYVERGANVNATHDVFVTHFAAIVAFASVEIIEEYLKRQAQANPYNRYRKKTAMEAAHTRTSGVDEVKALLLKYGKPQVKEWLDRVISEQEPRVALYYVVLNADREFVDVEPLIKTCVEKGADLNAEYESYSSAFGFIVTFGSLELIEWCLNHNALINLPHNSFSGPKYYAKRPEVVALLEKYETIELKKAVSNFLDVVIDSNNVDKLKQLLASDIKVEFLCRNSSTPLLFAIIQSKKPELLKLLLEIKFELSGTFEGKTPLEFAEIVGDKEMIDLLRSTSI